MKRDYVNFENTYYEEFWGKIYLFLFYNFTPLDSLDVQLQRRWGYKVNFNKIDGNFGMDVENFGGVPRTQF